MKSMKVWGVLFGALIATPLAMKTVSYGSPPVSHSQGVADIQKQLLNCKVPGKCCDSRDSRAVSRLQSLAGNAPKEHRHRQRPALQWLHRP